MFGPGLTLTLRPDLRERGPWQLMSCLGSVAPSYFPYYFLNRKVGTKIIKRLGKVLDDLSQHCIHDEHQKLFRELLLPSRRGRTHKTTLTLKGRATHSRGGDTCRLADLGSQRSTKWCSPTWRDCLSLEPGLRQRDIQRLRAEHVQTATPSALLGVICV